LDSPRRKKAVDRTMINVHMQLDRRLWNQFREHAQFRGEPMSTVIERFVRETVGRPSASGRDHVSAAS
jgi:hypothetical protein